MGEHDAMMMTIFYRRSSDAVETFRDGSRAALGGPGSNPGGARRAGSRRDDARSNHGARGSRAVLRDDRSRATRGSPIAGAPHSVALRGLRGVCRGLGGRPCNCRSEIRV